MLGLIAIGVFLIYQRGSLSNTPTSEVFTKVSPTIISTTSTQKGDVQTKVEVFAKDLLVPWSLVFTSTSRALVTERPGNIRVIENGSLINVPLYHFSEVKSVGEEGLMGLALDPDYQKNKHIFVCIAYSNNGKDTDKVVRLIDEGTTAKVDKTVLDNIPSAQNHAGCRIKFGPDKKLYITTGDATSKDIAQDKSSLGGKILRMNSDGSIPADNPTSGSPVWTLGHRNPQGIAWHPVSGVMFETEHGPSGFDGPGGGDEVNIIKKGENYGWPIVHHTDSDPRFVTPKLVFTPAVAPADGMFYSSDVIPQYKNSFFFAALKGTGIYRVVISNDKPEEILSYEKMKDVDVGRVREITQGPDGAIYFTTSNRDGRGSARDGDDKIYRIIPL